MPIETDILNILKVQGPSQPSKIRKTLETMTRYKAPSYSERGLDVVIVRKLSDFEKSGYVTAGKLIRQKRMYQITDSGIKYLQNRLMLDPIETLPKRFLEVHLEEALQAPIDRKNPRDLSRLNTLTEVKPEEKARVDIMIWLDEENRERIDSVTEELQKEPDSTLIPRFRVLASLFVAGFKEAVMEAKNARYQWKNSKDGPLQMVEVVKQERASLDFNAYMLLHFDGRDYARTTDWNRYLKHFEKSDKIRTRRLGDQ
jgi:DNA-binding PadR family transcriptional regulator